jgi:hypothetical protein
VFTYIVPFLLVFFAFLLMLVHLDMERIRRRFYDEGAAVVSMQWRPFRQGWTSEKLQFGDGNRIYEVCYRNVNGSLRHVWCKTCLLNGVALERDELSIPTQNAQQNCTS